MKYSEINIAKKKKKLHLNNPLLTIHGRMVEISSKLTLSKNYLLKCTA